MIKYFITFILTLLCLNGCVYLTTHDHSNDYKNSKEAKNVKASDDKNNKDSKQYYVVPFVVGENNSKPNLLPPVPQQS